MVDRIEFSPLGGVDPRQLFAQRDARAALVNSLATEAPRISAPGPRPAPEAPEPVERPQRETEQRTPREEEARQNVPGAPGAQQNSAPALGGAEEVPEQEAEAPDAAALGPAARIGPDAFQISVPGTDLARAQGTPLFGGGGFRPAGSTNPLVRETAPLGEGGKREQVDFGPKPLGGGGVPGTPPTPAAQTPGAPGPGRTGQPAPTPQNAGAEQGRSEPRGSVVDVLV